MRAVTTAVVNTGGRLESVVCQPPLTLRQVHSDEPECCALCLVATSAGPLAGDDLEFNLTLRSGACATLQATGASLAQGDSSGESRLRTRVILDEDANLRGRPGPVVVAAGGRVDVAVALDLAAGAHIQWQELVVLGRTSQAKGAATLRWDVTRAGRPLLRQVVDLTDPVLTAWPGMLSGGRVIASALISGPDVLARTVVASDTAVAARLDENTVLVTVLGSDAAVVSRALADLMASAVARPLPAAGSPNYDIQTPIRAS
jgi:urease accessory protein